MFYYHTIHGAPYLVMNQTLQNWPLESFRKAQERKKSFTILLITYYLQWRHDTRQNGPCHNNTCHNSTRHSDTQINDAEHLVMLSWAPLCWKLSECRIFIVMLSVVTPSVVMLSVMASLTILRRSIIYFILDTWEDSNNSYLGCFIPQRLKIV